MNKINYVIVVILALLAGMAGAWLRPGANTAGPKESAYERVMRTGEIRCGYGIFAPYMMKDVQTGTYSGIWHDYTEAIANHLGLKIVWAEETPLADIGAALDSGRIDIYCGGLWTAGQRVRVIDYLKPSAFEPLLAFVRSDDYRFDSDMNAINDPSVGIATMDGEGGGLVAAEDFPKARPVSVPQISGYSDMFMQVITRKADVVIAAPSGAAAFMKNNPGKLKALAKPLRIFPVSLAVGYGQESLRDMLDQAGQDVIYNGTMDKILAKYEVNKGDFWRVSTPYQKDNTIR